jgi:hypothetical protein
VSADSVIKPKIFLNHPRSSWRARTLTVARSLNNLSGQHDEICFVLSPDFYMDEQFLPFRDAVDQAIICLDAILIIGSSFAVVFGEPMKGGRGKFLLSEV